MLIVHHLEDSRSQRVLWLLEELGASYEVKRYERDPDTMLAPPELKDIHPLGKSPVIQHEGETVAETGPIFEYILEKFDAANTLCAPHGTPEQRQVSYWLHFAEGTAMTPLLLKLVFMNLPRNAPFLMKPLVKGMAGRAEDAFIDPRLREQIDYWEAALGDTGWFAGPNMTAADIMMSFPLEAAANRAGAGEKPNISGFLTRIHERDSYKRALERGGPYSYA